jgi:flagellar assembly protein FliH
MNSLSKNKILKHGPVVSYSMPTLEYFPLSDTEGPPAGKNDPEIIEREAFAQGFATGEKAGYEAGEQKATVLIDQLEKLFREVYHLKEKLLSELEPQVVLLSIGLARAILREEMKTNPEIVEHMVKEAVKEISPVGPILIKLNPVLYDRLNKKKKEFQTLFPNLIFEMDRKAPEGGGIVCNSFQEIQTDLDFQLSNIIEELRNQVRNGGSDPLP